MLGSVALVLVLSSVARAQSSIPSGISASCTNFLSAFNSDPSLEACLKPLVTITAAFTPISQHHTPAEVTSVLSTFCADSAVSSCPIAFIHSKLTDFWVACTRELMPPVNPAVGGIYDILYAMTSLRNAVCTKDDTGAWCVTKATRPSSTSSSTSSSSSSSTSSTVSPTPASHAKRAPQAPSPSPSSSSSSSSSSTSSPTPSPPPPPPQVAFTPNISNIAATNMLFLYLTPDLPAQQLCTTCAKNILTTYIDFESRAPYAPGLSQSILFPGQLPLYQAMVTTCGQDFFGGVVAAAGSLGSGILNHSGALSDAHFSLGLMGITAGLIAVGFASVS